MTRNINGRQTQQIPVDIDEIIKKAIIANAVPKFKQPIGQISVDEDTIKKKRQERDKILEKMKSSPRALQLIEEKKVKLNSVQE